MKTIPNAKVVLMRAWSMWAAYAAIVFAILDAIQPGLANLLPELEKTLPAHLFDGLTWVCLVAVPVLRIIHQGIAAADAAKGGQ